MKAAQIREAIEKKSRLRVEIVTNDHKIMSAADFASDCDGVENLTDEELEMAFQEWIEFDDYIVGFEAEVLDR